MGKGSAGLCHTYGTRRASHNIQMNALHVTWKRTAATSFPFPSTTRSRPVEKPMARSSGPTHCVCWVGLGWVDRWRSEGG